MPSHAEALEGVDLVKYQAAVEELNASSQRAEPAPTQSQTLKDFDVACFILNRTIGSGIFVTPSIILAGAGSVGGALLLWAGGGGIAICGLLVWLELGLSFPLLNVPHRNELTSVPRSGGEKNYLEFMFPRPKYLATCMFGVCFIFLGNLSGNAIAFGRIVMEAIGYSESNLPKGPVLALAIAALLACIILHIISREAGIVLNKFFAITKIFLLLAIFILGMIKAGGHRLGGSPKATENFYFDESFKGGRKDVASFVDSLWYVIYAYSGFDQPFYVLSEVSSPRKTFPRSTIYAMLTVLVLFMLTNVAYLCVVPKSIAINSTEDMASLFLGRVFGNNRAKIAMKAFIAFSIFGNILVQTFTAGRVKQELAKEGIFLKLSLFFATCHTSLWAWAQRIRRPSQPIPAAEDIDNHLERTPMAALGLHGFTALLLIAITSKFDTRIAYNVLVTLYSYVMVIGMGFVVSGGLLLTTWRGVSAVHVSGSRESRRWDKFRNFKPWFTPAYAVIYFLSCGFLLFAAFAKPSAGSPYSYAAAQYARYVIPVIGLSAWFWGGAWFLGLHFILSQFMNRKLKVKRIVYIIPDNADPGQWIFKADLVTHDYSQRAFGQDDTDSTHELDVQVTDSPVPAD